MCDIMYNTGADPFGFPTLYRPWDDGTDSLENAKRRLRAAFEFFVKLGVSVRIILTTESSKTVHSFMYTFIFIAH